MYGTLFLISGPSGIGKSSLIKALIQKTPNIKRLISYTTRTPRPEEINGLDYYFTSSENFNALLENHTLINAVKIFDHDYATESQQIVDNLKSGKNVILDVDPKSALFFKKNIKHCILIMLTGTPTDILKNRLHTRGDPPEECIKRLSVVESIKDYYPEYHYFVKNENMKFDATLLELQNIIQIETNKRNAITQINPIYPKTPESKESFTIDELYQNNLDTILNTQGFSTGTILTFRDPNSIIDELKDSNDNPEIFMAKQNALIYTRKNLINQLDFIDYFKQRNYTLQLHSENNGYLRYQILSTQAHSKMQMEPLINQSGLPAHSEHFYPSAGHTTQPSAYDFKQLSNIPGRILNIASGANPNKKLFAINIDNAPEGEPDYITEVDNLSMFPNGYFTLVRASHILEHFYPHQISMVLKEWTRVLHPTGELHIMVPDSAVVLQEIQTGLTNKGSPSLSLKTTTSTLAQLYGLGYEHEATNSKWRHRILFSKELLQHFLHISGFDYSEILDKAENLASICNIKDDSSNHYSLSIRARRAYMPHPITATPSNDEFHRQIEAFKSRFPLLCNNIELSVIVPIKNEEQNLEQFLNSLLQVSNKLNTLNKREYILVLNGCTDGSLVKIQQFVQEYPKFPIKIIESSIGIVNAFKAGIDARSLKGLVAKLDADTVIHPYALELMILKLMTQAELQVTYAEPKPRALRNQNNWTCFKPDARSTRTFIHGRASLYRCSPFELFNFSLIRDAKVVTEDIILSYAFALHYGLESIAPTPGAFVCYKPHSTAIEYQTKIHRTQQELNKIESFFPYFKCFHSILKRKTLNIPDEYKLEPINTHASKLEHTAEYKDEWERLDTSKGRIQCLSPF